MDLAIPAFGYSEETSLSGGQVRSAAHISIDRRYRLIRRWKTTDASAHDGARLREGLLDRSNTGSAVWADTAYRSAANAHFMERHGFTSKVHHKKPPHRDMPVQTKRSNAGKSVIRSRVEHAFADQKSRMGLFVRTVGIKRAEMKIGLANLVCNIRRYLYLKRVNPT
jgi:transposase, IS5 family